MSLEAILAELPRLTQEERKVVDEKLYELYEEETRALIEQWRSEPPLPAGYWAEVFKDWTGQCKEDMPTDFSLNHDHYLYGRPKEW